MEGINRAEKESLNDPEAGVSRVNFEEIAKNLWEARKLVDSINDVFDGINAGTTKGEHKIVPLIGQFETELRELMAESEKKLSDIEAERKNETDPILAKKLSAAAFSLDGFLGTKESLKEVSPGEFKEASRKLEEMKKLIN